MTSVTNGIAMDPIEEVKESIIRGMKRSRAMFQNLEGKMIQTYLPSERVRIASKIRSEYGSVQNMEDDVSSNTGDRSQESESTTQPGRVSSSSRGAPETDGASAGASESSKQSESVTASPAVESVIKSMGEKRAAEPKSKTPGTSIVAYNKNAASGVGAGGAGSRALVPRRAPPRVPTPEWHAPWKLMRVISGHLGWVRSVAVEPGNEWFATGSADRSIKIWDLASGTLKLTLTGHINTVRGLAVSPRHPYLFSAGEDKAVKCWDLEYNKVIRHYHGHLSGVYCLSLHPTLDVLVTGGRDSVARVWDMRSKQQIHVLGGHSNTVVSMITQSTDPQIITGSMDSTVKLWDLAEGRCMTTLTNHKKAVRAMVACPGEHTFVSGAADNLKKWQTREGKFIRNFSGHNAIINTLSANQDGVLVSGGDNGSLRFWDFATGYCFQKQDTIVQPGSLDAEAGIYTSTFDVTGTRLITGEADKTIKIWKEDESASPETHPIDMKSWTKECQAPKRF